MHAMVQHLRQQQLQNHRHHPRCLPPPQLLQAYLQPPRSQICRHFRFWRARITPTGPALMMRKLLLVIAIVVLCM
jgi:hypothetical protein